MSNPKCAYTFMQYLSKNPKALSNFICNKLTHVHPFDVSLRDGLQCLTKTQQNYFTTQNKISFLNYNLNKYNVKNFEIGSCVNSNLFPIFNDTDKLINYYNNYCLDNNSGLVNNYVLVPNEKYLEQAVKYGAINFSFITSVSNSFQLKNNRMNLSQNFSNLNIMMNRLKNTNIPHKVKIYVSCVNECPFEGKIDTEKIVVELFSISLLEANKICLADTCGTLKKKEFIDIIENTKKLGIDVTNFSLHLHVNPEREKEVEDIFHTALDYGIKEFDVTDLKTGGCSVTMDKSKLFPNMNYEQYYKFFTSYLSKTIV